jgi:hypothetical protein
MILTVGELKKFLEGYDDNVKIVTSSSNYELRGECVDAKVREVKFSKKTRQFRDDFDGTNYSSDVYTTDKEDGEQVIWILG